MCSSAGKRPAHRNLPPQVMLREEQRAVRVLWLVVLGGSAPTAKPKKACLSVDQKSIFCTTDSWREWSLFTENTFVQWVGKETNSTLLRGCCHGNRGQYGCRDEHKRTKFALWSHVRHKVNCQKIVRLMLKKWEGPNWIWAVIGFRCLLEKTGKFQWMWI